jgi:hypothetical protein
MCVSMFVSIYGRDMGGWRAGGGGWGVLYLTQHMSSVYKEQIGVPSNGTCAEFLVVYDLFVMSGTCE